MTPPVPIIGATGALGFGPAVRRGAAGVAVLIGSADPRRAPGAAQRAAARIRNTGRP